MKIILDIFRWLFGLFFGFVMFMIVVTMIPMSILGRQVLQRESGLQWLTAFTKSDDTMVNLRTSILRAASESDTVDDPALTKVFADATDETTSIGKSVSTLFSARVMRENILQNADAFYKWLDGTATTLSLKITLGGTSADLQKMVSNVLKERYDSLPKCTTSQLKEIQTAKLGVAEVECSPGKVSSSVFDKAAADMLATAPEIQQMTKDGFVFKPEVSQNDRISILFFKKMSTFMLIVAWALMLLMILFMVLLFTPKGINLIVSGLIVGFTGMTLGILGGGMAAVSNTAGQEAVFEVIKAFAMTLGRPLLVQGAIIGAIGGLLIILGIAKLVKKNPTSSVVSTVESRPVQAEEVKKVEVEKVVKTTESKAKTSGTKG